MPATERNPNRRRGEVTRDAILDAATERFSAYGFRRTSMDDIAVAAGCSRASIYFHFGTKEDVFRALSQRLHDDRLAAMEAAGRGSGDIQSRVLAMLDARFTAFVEITSQSPHGDELLDQSSRIGSEIGGEADRRTIEILAATLRSANRSGELDLTAASLSAPAAARVIVDSAQGAKDQPTTGADEYRRRLRAIVRVLIRGLRP